MFLRCTHTCVPCTPSRTRRPLYTWPSPWACGAHFTETLSSSVRIVRVCAVGGCCTRRKPPKTQRGRTQTVDASSRVSSRLPVRILPVEPFRATAFITTLKRSCCCCFVFFFFCSCGGKVARTATVSGDSKTGLRPSKRRLAKARIRNFPRVKVGRQRQHCRQQRMALSCHTWMANAGSAGHASTVTVGTAKKPSSVRTLVQVARFSPATHIG